MYYSSPDKTSHAKQAAASQSPVDIDEMNIGTINDMVSNIMDVVQDEKFIGYVE